MLILLILLTWMLATWKAPCLLAKKKSGKGIRVGTFLDFARSKHLHVYATWGVRADERAKSNWPPFGVGLSGSRGVPRAAQLAAETRGAEVFPVRHLRVVAANRPSHALERYCASGARVELELAPARGGSKTVQVRIVTPTPSVVGCPFLHARWCGVV